jgi:hypothetical protein
LAKEETNKRETDNVCDDAGMQKQVLQPVCKARKNSQNFASGQNRSFFAVKGTYSNCWVKKVRKKTKYITLYFARKTNNLGKNFKISKPLGEFWKNILQYNSLKF